VACRLLGSQHPRRRDTSGGTYLWDTATRQLSLDSSTLAAADGNVLARLNSMKQPGFTSASHRTPNNEYLRLSRSTATL
jgi:hypothetical protein